MECPSLQESCYFFSFQIRVLISFISLFQNSTPNSITPIKRNEQFLSLIPLGRSGSFKDTGKSSREVTDEPAQLDWVVSGYKKVQFSKGPLWQSKWVASLYLVCLQSVVRNGRPRTSWNLSPSFLVGNWDGWQRNFLTVWHTCSMYHTVNLAQVSSNGRESLYHPSEVTWSR